MATAIRGHDQGVLAVLDGWLGLDRFLLWHRLRLRKRLNLHHWRLWFHCDDLLRRFINTDDLRLSNRLYSWLFHRLNGFYRSIGFDILWLLYMLNQCQNLSIFDRLFILYWLCILVNFCWCLVLINCKAFWRSMKIFWLFTRSNLCHSLSDVIQHRFNGRYNCHPRSIWSLNRRFAAWSSWRVVWSRWLLLNQRDSSLTAWRRCHWYCINLFLEMLYNSLWSNSLRGRWRCLWLCANTHSLHIWGLSMGVLQCDCRNWFIFIIDFFHIFIIDLNRSIFGLGLLSDLLWDLRHEQLLLFSLSFLLWVLVITWFIWWRAALVELLLYLRIFRLSAMVLHWWKYAKITILASQP